MGDHESPDIYEVLVKLMEKLKYDGKAGKTKSDTSQAVIKCNVITFLLIYFMSSFYSMSVTPTRI